MRRTPAAATTAAPATAASSSVAASGAWPSQPKNETSTFWVFCRMNTASRSRSTTSRSTADQNPLVRDPRRGSGWPAGRADGSCSETGSSSGRGSWAEDGESAEVTLGAYPTWAGPHARSRVAAELRGQSHEGVGAAVPVVPTAPLEQLDVEPGAEVLGERVQQLGLPHPV